MIKTRKRYLALGIFVGVTIVGVFIYYLSPTNFWLWELWETLNSASAVALAILAFMSYQEYIKGEDIIPIYFQLEEENDKRKVYTKLYTQRRHFTRGEVLGLLRMIQCVQGTFVLADFNKNPKILERFEAIHNGESNELIIYVDRDELEQFNVL